LIVCLKDPGYVTSYVLRGDEFEEDIEAAKREYNDKSKLNESMMN